MRYLRKRLREGRKGPGRNEMKRNTPLSTDADGRRICEDYILVWVIHMNVKKNRMQYTVLLIIAEPAGFFMLRRYRPLTYLVRVPGLTCDGPVQWGQHGCFAYSAG